MSLGSPAGLAGRLRPAPDAQQVVHGLKREAEVHAEFLQDIDDGLLRSGQERADGRGVSKQRAGLVGRHPQAFLHGDVESRLEREILGLALIIRAVARVRATDARSSPGRAARAATRERGRGGRLP